ncbi:helix-turn-helix transcriptional regulator [Acrocarpospora pleiomorpha]|uniref:Helix-turn-helix transcriptional regulator n=1 Tax=Acrocarpospora pleiomorpha TaxID=90975 RepID=A0A5M3XUD3_9ACTN|nr:helix-turn-helix transcriptional regulator [Acrocarpospora pleiomorpha]
MKADMVGFEQKLARQHSALDVLSVTASEVLNRVPADVWCTVLLDPSTLLDTGGQNVAGFPDEYLTRLFEIEHLEADDPGNLRDLANSAAMTSLLSRSTAGRLDVSKYYQEILRPQGLGDELRVVMRDGPRIWGMIVMCRESGAAPYTAADEAAAAQVSRPATVALRRSLLLSGVDEGRIPDAPGFIVVDRDATVRTASRTALSWLELLQDGAPIQARPVRAVISAARRAGVARSRALTRSGQWVALQAWSMDQGEEQLVAISLGPPEPGELTAVILGAYGLSEREQQITQQAMRGHSTERIAAHLNISSHTVQDHLKSVFVKTGLGSRRALVADIFFRHYLPAFGDGPLSTDGRRFA